MVGLLGPYGGGKLTLLKTIASLLYPGRGWIFLFSVRLGVVAVGLVHGRVCPLTLVL